MESLISYAGWPCFRNLYVISPTLNCNLYFHPRFLWGDLETFGG